ncbi:hypothetical protein PSAB6_220070 [Paraburkholderia sabiae]|nr:hypothetical protein PSAB6_220070 [Paraburkholderia sabiae]
MWWDMMFCLLRRRSMQTCAASQPKQADGAWQALSMSNFDAARAEPQPTRTSGELHRGIVAVAQP